MVFFFVKAVAHHAHASLVAQNDASYRVLVALMINTISLRARPWRARAKFEDDTFKSFNQVACSEFVIKVSLQAGDRLGAVIAHKLIETRVDTSVPPGMPGARWFTAHANTRISQEAKPLWTLISTRIAERRVTAPACLCTAH